jgi:hypothetical protein
MDLRDFIVTPVILILVFWGAYIIRPWVTDEITRRYFFSALFLRVFGALAVGFLYQFYYGGGDTFAYHTLGSRVVWEAFTESPIKGLQLIITDNKFNGELFKYATRIEFYRDPSAYFVVRVASIFDLITFSSYSATAVLFSVLSFAGAWVFYLVFYRVYPHLHRWLALGILFVPSVLFWGSGIMKDTLTLSALGFLTYSVRKIFFDKQASVKSFIIMIVSVLVIYSIKKYILLCYLPALLLWVNVGNLARIKSRVLKVLIVPFVLVIIILTGYFSIDIVGKDDPRYAIESLGKTAQVTAYDIAYQTGRGAGSTYILGELDGTFNSMIRLAPQAINVSLFRPYFWEIRNPLMLLSSTESLFLLCFTLFLLFKRRTVMLEALRNPDILFCMVFSITFAFAVGVSTFNFGTLARYKIPLLPFYLIGLILMLNYSKKEDSVI